MSADAGASAIAFGMDVLHSHTRRVPPVTAANYRFDCDLELTLRFDGKE
jgi:hypothetical protein